MGETHPQRFEDWSAGSVVETDSFCAGCGYNLRGQVTRREPFTQLWMARCPECGRFAAAEQLSLATRLWARRLGVVVLLVYLATLLAWVAGLAFCFFIAVLVGLESLRDWDSAMQRAHYTLDDRDAWIALGLILALVAGGAFVADALAATATPHWPRRGRLALLVGWPALGAAAMGVIAGLITLGGGNRSEVQAILALTPVLFAAAVAGGLVGIALNRRHVRLLVRIALPPKLRPVLAYLWLADGLEPPSEAKPSQ